MTTFLSADSGLLVVATGCPGIAGVVGAACIKNGTADCCLIGDPPATGTFNCSHEECGDVWTPVSVPHLVHLSQGFKDPVTIGAANCAWDKYRCENGW